MGLLFLYGFITILLSFICSILEAVLLSVNPTFIKIKIKEGLKYAENLQKLKNSIDEPLVIILTLCGLFINAQEKVKIKGLTRNEIKAIKKEQKEKDRIAKYASMGLNQWGINENAQTWYLALKFHLPSSRNGDGLPILRQYQTFTQESSRIYPLWIIDGQQFNSPPVDVLALSPLIRKVRLLVNAAETNRWGKQARAGVIVLETAR